MLVLINEADGSGRCLARGSEGLSLTRPFAMEFLQNRAETCVTTASISDGAPESVVLSLVVLVSLLLFRARTESANAATVGDVDGGGGRSGSCSGTLTLMILLPLSLAFLFLDCSGTIDDSAINENDLFDCLLTSTRW